MIKLNHFYIASRFGTTSLLLYHRKVFTPSGLNNYNYLQETSQKNGMTVLKDFLQWYKNKNGVPNLVAMQKLQKHYSNWIGKKLELGDGRSTETKNMLNLSLKEKNVKIHLICFWILRKLFLILVYE